MSVQTLRKSFLRSAVSVAVTGQRKKGVISKLKAFFEKYFSISGSVKSSDEPEEKKVVTYNFAPQAPLMVAKGNTPYGTKKEDN